jgi:hypothetical protein
LARPFAKQRLDGSIDPIRREKTDNARPTLEPGIFNGVTARALF